MYANGINPIADCCYSPPDECGVPGGDNSSCLDECGVPNGNGFGTTDFPEIE